MTSVQRTTVRIGTGQFAESAGTGDWRVLGDGTVAWFRTGSFEDDVRLVQAIGELRGLADH